MGGGAAGLALALYSLCVEVTIDIYMKSTPSCTAETAHRRRW